MRRALLIVAKAPEPGRTKTRLVPPLTPDQAAELSKAFLLDTLHLARQLAWERISVVAPAGSATALAPLLPPEVILLEQRGIGLGDALRHAFASHFAESFSRVVLIGSDSPTLPAAFIRQACAALERFDLSVGPSVDGGYYLIGMRQPHLGVFEDISWSTASVFAETLQRAHALSLNVSTLPTWYDVDDAEHLARLRNELRSSPADLAPHTRAALQTLSLVAPAASASV
ncbi:MAG: TIGR04282 family arsenosugar biosynthesis glycosyltransferase [Chloroflexi bacterium]|nr:TIGR04282 family arsenosugar biosynthesis glycosyltransferase [Chloroflexota bacterium]